MSHSIFGFVIALKGNPTDLPNIKTYLPNVRRFDAVDTRQGDLSTLSVHPAALAGIQKSYFSDSFQIPSKGAIGCALSHYAVWEQCMARGTPVIVMEEDVVFDRATATAILKGLNTLPPDAMYATLMNTPQSIWNYTSPDRRLVGSQHEGWYTLGLGVVGTQCYYLSPKGAEILLQHAYPVTFQVDMYIACVGYTNPDFRAYATMHNPYSTNRYLADCAKSTIGYSKLSVRVFLPESNWFYVVVCLVFVATVVLCIVGWKKKKSQ
jgi:GR25 family glycosyltransferase involved in LPS biosynthesis